MPSFTLPITHRPGREGEPASDGHVPFFLAMEFAMAAYLRAMTQWCGDLVVARDMVIVNVAGDFRKEVFTGHADFDVALTRLGTSSLTVLIELAQGGVPAVSAALTLVQVGQDRVRSRPFTPQQRQLLEQATA